MQIEYVGWAKRSVHTIGEKNGGHASLCPPYNNDKIPFFNRKTYIRFPIEKGTNQQKITIYRRVGKAKRAHHCSEKR